MGFKPIYNDSTGFKDANNTYAYLPKSNLKDDYKYSGYYRQNILKVASSGYSNIGLPFNKSYFATSRSSTISDFYADGTQLYFLKNGYCGYPKPSYIHYSEPYECAWSWAPKYSESTGWRIFQSG